MSAKACIHAGLVKAHGPSNSATVLDRPDEHRDGEAHPDAGSVTDQKTMVV
jgi:hypothetical protein